MAHEQGSILKPLLQKLSRWQQFTGAEEQAILALPHRSETLSSGGYIVREGDLPRHTCLLLTGFACRHKTTRGGARSIHSVHMAGDFVDLQNALMSPSDHAVQTLTKAHVAFVDRDEILDLAFRHPRIGMALWQDTLVDASIFREWITNVGRRDAIARLAHLICEFGVRLAASGLGDRQSFELPMTQELLADAVGLTPVHVNRTLMDMERDGLFTRTIRYVVVPDWRRLASAGDFDEAYLHLRPPSQGYVAPRAHAMDLPLQR